MHPPSRSQTVCHPRSKCATHCNTLQYIGPLCKSDVWPSLTLSTRCFKPALAPPAARAAGWLPAPCAAPAPSLRAWSTCRGWWSAQAPRAQAVRRSEDGPRQPRQLCRWVGGIIPSQALKCSAEGHFILIWKSPCGRICSPKTMSHLPIRKHIESGLPGSWWTQCWDPQTMTKNERWFQRTGTASLRCRIFSLFSLGSLQVRLCKILSLGQFCVSVPTPFFLCETRPLHKRWELQTIWQSHGTMPMYCLCLCLWVYLPCPTNMAEGSSPKYQPRPQSSIALASLRIKSPTHTGLQPRGLLLYQEHRAPAMP